MTRKVLIVDDISTNLYMLETLLKGYGLEVTSAENGKEALDKARLNPPDLIVTDILMPVMDGYALCRQWKSDDKLKHIPLVFYTATYREPKDEKFALSLGADRFILKPQEPDIFMNILKEVFGEKYTARQAVTKPFCEEMEFFRKHNEILFGKLEKKMSDLEIANQKLRESEEKYRTILEDMDDIYFEVDIKGNITFVNHSSCKMSGYSEDELLGMPFKKISAPDGIEMVKQYFGEIFLTGKTGKPFLWNLEKKNGEQGFSELVASLIRDKQGKPIGFKGIGRDVTERKKTEKDLQNSEELFRNLFQHHAAVKLIIDPYTGNIIDANEAAVNYYGWPREQITQMKIKDINTSREEEVKEAMEKVRVNNKIRFEFRHRRADGSVRDVEVFSSSIKAQGKDVLHSIVHDITERKQAETKLQQTLDSLRKAVNATIRVMVSVVESRDPYTAGHQIRSADLARAIATEMELPQDTIEGLRMAGSIHDIGKLSIPAEILSKPTKLLKIEFSLIKEHARTGYEMLKDVESPWPLAEIVYQHHERMDGSGYPRNLKGDEILMEARILMVADVVEAMASHRPYRPGLGIDAALSEIEKNRGLFYDEAVVDACRRLFREKGFTLDGT
ncbi:MAG: response regulator receiver [Syntrophaceae bacterium]|nr:MAG: response regulator receiver [Syntrophaceae bacterium]